MSPQTISRYWQGGKSKDAQKDTASSRKTADKIAFRTRKWYNNNSMEKQVGLGELLQSGAKATRKQKFLADMESIVPFTEWTAMIEPYYYKERADKRGRPPTGIEKMLRIYLLQVWYNLADEATEDNIYDSLAMQRFVGVDLMIDRVPDGTTLCLFRQMLTENKLQQKMMAQLTELLKTNKIVMTKGTIVDATTIHAPSSTKNEKKERDPYMKSVKKGNNWYFGCKTHIGVDSESGLVHTVKTTPANVHDSEIALDLLHGKEKKAYGDSAYLGIDKKPNAPKRVKFKITKRLSTINKMPDEYKRKIAKEIETKKCSIRAKVEHAFHIIKNKFGWKRVRYRGGEKNDSLFHILFASANLLVLKRRGITIKTT